TFVVKQNIREWERHASGGWIKWGIRRRPARLCGWHMSEVGANNRDLHGDRNLVSRLYFSLASSLAFSSSPPHSQSYACAFCSWSLLQLLMIIKGLFRRYQRWNPVHPTVGTFWGMGIGIGCGVGWGPGFGPEVIGYVGAGCGAGFSVGITLAGIGIGLPQNGLTQIAYNAFTTKTGSLDSARSCALTTMKSVAEDSLNYTAPYISFLRKETSWRLSRLKSNICVQRAGLNNLNTAVSKHIQSTLECLEACKDNFWPPGNAT
ncbi:hypothetical protein B296_00004903, partial [Ensete ventricosum]